MMKLTTLAMAASMSVLSAGMGFAQQTFDLQSTFPLSLPSVGDSPKLWAQKVANATNGEIRINVHGAGEIVPGLEVFDAVSSGALAMGFDWVGFQSAKIPVTNLIGAMPFGPESDVFLAWMFKGGGLEILQKSYDPYNVKVIPCHVLLTEAGGWFNKEINTVEDFNGLNMRISGLGGKVLAEHGAVTQLIPVSELYLSMERGRIDALEFSTPQLDALFRFDKVAEYYYFPGWHQPASWDSIIINMDVWNGFDGEQQQALVNSCEAHIAYNLYDQLDGQAEAVTSIVGTGVEIRRFPDEVLSALRATSKTVLEREAKSDPIFAEAYESLKAYQAKVGKWFELQDLSEK